MKKFLRNNGALIVIAAVLLAAVLGIGASFLEHNPLTGVINAIGAPFRALSTAVTNWTADRYDRAFRYDQLVEENDRLRRQVAELQESARKGEDALREVEQLRDLLGLAIERPELVYVDAAVSSRSSTNWGSDLTLNKGTSDDVSVDDCVIDQYGNLVGVVTEVGPNWALVTTVLNPNTELGGRISRIDSNAILEGDFTLMKQGELRLSYIPSDAKLIAGDQVITSGLGGIYPAGLFVGTVRSLHTEANGMDRYAIVEPAADVDGVRYVYIITDY